jgi:hypothetical protein
LELGGLFGGLEQFDAGVDLFPIGLLGHSQSPLFA